MRGELERALKGMNWMKAAERSDGVVVEMMEAAGYSAIGELGAFTDMANTIYIKG